MIGIRRAALPDPIRQDEFCIAIQRDPRVLIADHGIIALHMLLLAIYEGPYLIGLNLFRSNTADSGIVNDFATFAGQYKTAKNSTLVYSAEPSRGVDAYALRQQFDNAGEVLNGNTHFIEGLFLFVAKGAPTLQAAIALDFLEAVATVFFGRRLAEVTRHWEPCLSQAVGSQWL